MERSLLSFVWPLESGDDAAALVTVVVFTTLSFSMPLPPLLTSGVLFSLSTALF